jgi:hypothetical protein
MPSKKNNTKKKRGKRKPTQSSASSAVDASADLMAGEHPSASNSSSVYWTPSDECAYYAKLGEFISLC